jgi:hypothetical protein
MHTAAGIWREYAMHLVVIQQLVITSIQQCHDCCYELVCTLHCCIDKLVVTARINHYLVLFIRSTNRVYSFCD